MAEKLVIRHLAHASAAMVPNRGELVITEMQNAVGKYTSLYHFWSLLEVAKANLECKFSSTVGVEVTLDGEKQVLNPFYHNEELLWLNGARAYRANPDRTISVLPRPKEAAGL